MSLDVELTKTCKHCGHADGWRANITHDLIDMASAANVYGVVWRPEDHGIKTGRDLVEPLRKGIKRLKTDSDRYLKYNPKNGCGNYDTLLDFLQNYLVACLDRPDHDVCADR